MKKRPSKGSATSVTSGIVLTVLALLLIALLVNRRGQAPKEQTLVGAAARAKLTEKDIALPSLSGTERRLWVVDCNLENDPANWGCETHEDALRQAASIVLNRLASISSLNNVAEDQQDASRQTILSALAASDYQTALTLWNAAIEGSDLQVTIREVQMYA